MQSIIECGVHRHAHRRFTITVGAITVGVGMRLYPVQRFIVKLYYHIPLDDREKTINISDMFNQEIVYRFTEKEYLKYLFDEGRCNIEEQDHDRRELVLAIGRRGGKTMLSSLFASYEIYRLLNLENPQEYFGLPNGDRIQIISVATSVFKSIGLTKASALS